MFVCDGLPWLQLAIQLVGHRQPGLTIWTVHQPTVECRPACEVYLQIGVKLTIHAAPSPSSNPPRVFQDAWKKVTNYHNLV